jgi:CDP-diglyceride synthetase
MLERIITALVLVAVVLSCMFATQSHYPMFVLMIIAAGVAGYEWFKLMPRTTKNVNKPLAWGFGLLSAGLATLALYFNVNVLTALVVGRFGWSTGDYLDCSNNIFSTLFVLCDFPCDG